MRYTVRRGVSPIEQKFLDYHRSHPEVYTELVRLSREAKAAGVTKLGVCLLWEQLRWSRLLAGTKDADGFKMGNNLKPWYARYIMANNLDLDGLFDTRTMKRT